MSRQNIYLSHFGVCFKCFIDKQVGFGHFKVQKLVANIISTFFDTLISRIECKNKNAMDLNKFKLNKNGNPGTLCQFCNFFL